jgi:endogenous inhibitor of DNA gyrase (YacG/DUF329 family)
MKLNCPICKKQMTVPDDFETRPFCSPRCKKIDLANWLEGNYRLPRELLPEELEQLPREQQDELIAAALGLPVDRKLH